MDMKLIFIFSLFILAIDIHADIKNYVAKEDNTYAWKVLHEKEYKIGYRGYLIELNSQTWHNIKWTHKLRIVIPEECIGKPSNTLLIIGGTYKKDKERNDKAEKYGVIVAEKTKSPVAMLYDVPFQPLFGGLTEDRLLAETFERYRKTKDETWPIIFPMVKASVKAIDCMKEVLLEKTKIIQKGVFVTGPSKRGWTTWFMPIVDKRVIAIAPMVYDNLNISKQLDNQLAMWGKYSERISAYTNKNLPQKLKKKDKELLKLVKMIDPYEYVKELTVPKLLVNGTNDRFWALDSLSVYFDDLPGSNYLYYAANARHNLREGKDETISTIASFYNFIDGKNDFPDIKASYKKTPVKVIAKCRVEGDPWEVLLMKAVSNTKDFRESKWSEILVEKENHFYKTKVEIPKDKYIALYFQVIYNIEEEDVLRSSRIHIASWGEKKMPKSD